MPADLEPIATERRVSTEASGGLICRGADLVYLAESLYLGLFVLAAGLTGAGSVISIWFAAISVRGITIATLAFATAGLGFTFAAFLRPRTAYLWLRYSPLRQLSPLVVSLSAVLANGHPARRGRSRSRFYG